MEKQKERSPARRYLTALLAPAIVAGVMQLTWPFFEQSPVTLFLLAVVFSAWYGGLGPGLLSVLASFLFADYFFIAPYFFLWPARHFDLVDLVTLATVGSFISVLSGLMHRQSRRAEINLDISERAQESLSKLSAIVESSDDAIIGKTLEGIITSWNKGAEQIYGYTEEEITGRPISILLPPNCPEELPMILGKIRRGEPVEHYETERVRKDGRIISAFLTVSPIKNADGIVIGASAIAKDITERKRAEAVVREAEQKYRDIFENAREGIFQTTPEGQYIEANPALARMLGYESPEDLIRERTDIARQHYVDPQQREEFKRLLEEHDFVRGFEYEGDKKDGSKIWVSDSVRAVRDQSGVLLYYEGIAEDITERKRAEAALRESEELFSKAFHSSPAPLIITRLADGCYLNTNDAFLRTFEYERVEVIGQTVLSLNIYVKPEDRKTLIDELQEQGALRGYESQARTKSGRILDLLVFVERVKLKGEQCLLSTAYDITERKGVEEALRESEERYRELFENAKDAIYVHDLSGRYTSVNRATEKLSGYTREEIIGKNFIDFVVSKDVTRVRENLWKKLREEGETVYEVDVIDRDGLRVPVEVSSRLIYENGVVAGVQGTARDITERKRADEALRTYSRRLVEVQEEERKRIARELHDKIGQVLTAVKLNLQALQNASETSASKPYIEENIAAVDEALQRVRDLSLELRPSLLDELGLAAALRWYVARYAQRTGIVTQAVTESFEAGERIPRDIETACFRIAQEALTNTARHAQARRAWVKLRRLKGEIVLEVKDDGVGFDPETLRKYSSSAATLGLRGMEERALAVQGWLEIESAPSGGTAVRAHFPVARTGN
jgi:PAS domain S-box-containing protein